jgi:hypothetical protein
LLFHYNNGYTNAPHCYVIRKLPAFQQYNNILSSNSNITVVITTVTTDNRLTMSCVCRAPVYFRIYYSAPEKHLTPVKERESSDVINQDSLKWGLEFRDEIQNSGSFSWKARG